MFLTELLKKPFLKQPEDYNINVHPKKVQKDLTSDDDFINYRAFFDVDALYQNGILNTEYVYKQAEKIDTYRRIAGYPEVADAIEEIINEITYTPELGDYVNIECENESKEINKAIEKAFEKILKLLNTDKNFYEIIRQSYIDGQLNVHVTYEENGGIEKLTYIDPRFLIFDYNEKIYRYVDDATMISFSTDTQKEWLKYNIEEVCHTDFGIRDNNTGIILSPLEKSIKTANQLKTLEDLLIPLRFSRSVSRRVFNVDVSDLPSQKAEQAMRKIQEQFKYKKFYNADTGEVSNQQHITSMVEDYWFANRNGQKGTTVETIDESGNLGELGDIKYFYKKLYRSLGIPSNRIPDTEGDQSFDYDSTTITREDIKFFLYINRLRTAYIRFFFDLLKRELVSTKVMKEEEFKQIKDTIKIFFLGENIYLERLKLNNFNKRIEVYSSARDYSGSLFPVSYLYTEIFKMSEDEIKDLMIQIQKEKKNPLFKHLYDEQMGMGGY